MEENPLKLKNLHHIEFPVENPEPAGFASLGFGACRGLVQAARPVRELA